MHQPIDIASEDLDTVKMILQHHVPKLEVRVFGSRVMGTAQRYSDLDLVFMTKKSLNWVTLSEMREAFSESTLPFKVDLVDWASTQEDFRRIIQQEWVVIHPL